ncbi:MAG: alpha/beta hydrolase [Kangiellaceae bacterium]|jgi:acetyl esterase|nr:alpha/beta hydrolase [Kangiellaceae bacterium]
MVNYINLEPAQRKLGKVLGFLPPMEKLPPKMVRMVFRAFDASFGLAKTDMQQVNDREIQIDDQATRIKIRSYFPNAETNGTLVYFHGGGCVIGSIETHDNFCRLLAHHGKKNVISVAYRLAPEHKFPAPVLDALNSWNWIIANYQSLNIDINNIGVAGDSAGAYLAAMISLEKEHEVFHVSASKKPNFQFLIYPMADVRGTNESYLQYTKNLLLTQDLMNYFGEHFIDDRELVNNSYLSIVLSEDLANCPKTYLATAQFDPLYDGGKELAETLQQSGVEVEYKNFADSMHGFISVAKISKSARVACFDMAKRLSTY